MVFVKGNKLGHGRPKKSKNIIPELRQMLLNEAKRRWKVLKQIKQIDDDKLLDAIIKLMPKDTNVTLGVQEGIRYITNTPRPQLEDNDVSIYSKSHKARSIYDDKTIDINVLGESQENDPPPPPVGGNSESRSPVEGGLIHIDDFDSTHTDDTDDTDDNSNSDNDLENKTPWVPLEDDNEEKETGSA